MPAEAPWIEVHPKTWLNIARLREHSDLLHKLPDLWMLSTRPSILEVSFRHMQQATDCHLHRLLLNSNLTSQNFQTTYYHLLLNTDHVSFGKRHAGILCKTQHQGLFYCEPDCSSSSVLLMVLQSTWGYDALGNSRDFYLPCKHFDWPKHKNVYILFYIYIYNLKILLMYDFHIYYLIFILNNYYF